MSSVVAGVDAVVGGAVDVNSACSGAAGVDAVVVGADVVGVAGIVEHGVAGGRGVVGDSKWLMLRFNEC